MILGFFPLSIICDERRHPRRGAPRRVNKREHFKKHGTAPPCPDRGPEAGNPHIYDFHGSGVNSLCSCPFLQSKKKSFFDLPHAASCVIAGKVQGIIAFQDF